MNARDRFGWEELYALVEQRKRERPGRSQTTKLLAQGREGVSRRIAEQALVTALAAERGQPAIFIGAVTDLLYHVTVLMAMVGVTPTQVAELLRERHEVIEKQRGPKARMKKAAKGGLSRKRSHGPGI